MRARVGEGFLLIFHSNQDEICFLSMQLGIETRRSSRQIEQRKPISVDKMYSSKPCSSTLSGHKLRVHAIDPDEKADDEKSEPSTRYSFRNYIKKYVSITVKLFRTLVLCIPCST